jgi:RNA polymerase sigma factor (TIGR02999 family)
MQDITQLLQLSSAGDAAARNALVQALYQQLKVLAHRARSHAQVLRQHNGRQDLTLNTTALVHELYLDVCGAKLPTFSDRAEFFRYSASAMQHLLIDHARRRLAQKRGSGQAHVALDEVLLIDNSDAIKLVAVDEVLTHLRQQAPRTARVLSLKFFAGLDENAIAELLKIDVRTVRRDWQKARAFVSLRLDDELGLP